MKCFREANKGLQDRSLVKHLGDVIPAKVIKNQIKIQLFAGHKKSSADNLTKIWEEKGFFLMISRYLDEWNLSRKSKVTH